MLKDAVWRIPTQAKTVYLTFDDGPIPGVTEKVLAILSQHDVKATFFCLGKNVEANSRLFQELKSAGHQIGNHSFSHPDGWDTPNSAYFDDIESANKVINSKLFRPPYGKLSLPQYAHLKKTYRIIMWDILTGDYNPELSPEFCFDTVKRKARPGSIIVFHDSIKAAPQMIEALKFSVEWLKGEGYAFGLLEE